MYLKEHPVSVMTCATNSGFAAHFTVLKLIPLILLLFCFNFVPGETIEGEAVVSKELAASLNELVLPKSIQPRSGGASWLYLSTYFEEEKKLPGGSSREEVIKVKEIDGATCYLVKLTMDWRTLINRLAGSKLSEDDYSYYWEYFTGKGSFNYTCEDEGDEPSSLDEFELTLPYPVQNGYTYKAEEADWKVVDDAVKVDVKAGEFTCVVYETIYIDEEFIEECSRERLYMAPGVGLVRWEMDFKLDGKWTLNARDDLIDYKLGETPSKVDVSD